ncbi:MAG: flagellar hook-basal body complex protein FliE [Succinivibrio sp.]|nr:flagellar hook-basal body complex protein FliE [Succinivibrio sp.]MBR1611990.1 flagellar hook-basal body complex protein FliE [Succinivibrio sp.]
MSSIGIETTPSFKDELINQVDAVSPDQKVDNVGAFANMLHNAFEQVNNLQNDAENKQTRFDLGDRSVTLSDVMLATQKSSISFDATMQIRNKMIEAYKTISQMQI